MTNIKNATLELLTNPELIALNQDPLALQAYVVSHQDGVYILVKDVETLYGKTRAVAFYNPTDNERTATLNFFDVNLGGTVKARDIFERKDIGTFDDTMTVTIPAHGTRIYRLEADERHERHIYEAETAWISAYQELDYHGAVHSGIYEENDALSGGAKVGWLGVREDNDLIWREVYSATGGEYEMTLAYISGEDRNFKVEVNGKVVQTIKSNTGGWDKVGTSMLNVTLKPGDNTIRLYTDEKNWMPDFDYMQILPVSQGVESIEDDDAEILYFDLNGLRVMTPTAGQLYIRRIGDRAEKVMY